MIMLHPSDRALEQYRNRSLFPAEARSVKQHLVHCERCRRRLQAWEALDRRLSALTMDEPAAGFTDRVIDRVYAVSSGEAGKACRRETAHNGAGRRWLRGRPELANALVATAGTYVFLSTGIMKAVFSLGAGRIEADLYARLQSIMDWVGHVSQALPL